MLRRAAYIYGQALDSSRKTTNWMAARAVCPSCEQVIVWLESTDPIDSARSMSIVVWPNNSVRPVPLEVPVDIAKDYTEASQILAISPQASAALTRRCLQQVLRDYGGTKSRDLFAQIQEVIATNHLSPSLAEQLDAVRTIGNFAAHPLKSTESGAILPVEPHEAEWNLDVLEATFDHYFVKPAQAHARKAALNLKLAEAGKPLLP